MLLRRSVLDVVMLLRHSGPAPELVAARATEWRARRATWLLLELAHRTDPSLGAGKVARLLAPPRAVRAALRALVPDAEATRLARLNHRLQAALLWPWLLDGPAVVARVVANHPLVTLLVERPG